MKKTLSIFLSIVMLLSITAGLNISVYADGDVSYPTTGPCGENATFTYDDATRTITISGTGIIPSNADKNINWAADKLIICEGITELSDFAFSNTSYNTVIVPSSVKRIGERALDSPDLVNIELPDTAIEISSGAFYNSLYYGDVNNWVDGVLYVGNHLIAAKEDVVTGDYKVKAGTKDIADCAFNNCKNLTSVTLPDGFELISETAFEWCENMISINFPTGIKKISPFAFAYCGLTNVVIPNSITEISKQAFYYCNLKSITLPTSVKSVGMYAFEGNFNLAEVNYLGTKAQWKNIVIATGNEALDKATINCTDGDISKTSTPTENLHVITVTLNKVTVKRSAKKLVLKAIVKEDGKALSGKKVVFKFNGKKYVGKTNNKGVAKVTVKKAVLRKLKKGKKIKITATYNKTTATRKVKVK